MVNFYLVVVQYFELQHRDCYGGQNLQWWTCFILLFIFASLSVISRCSFAVSVVHIVKWRCTVIYHISAALIIKLMYFILTKMHFRITCKYVVKLIPPIDSLSLLFYVKLRRASWLNCHVLLKQMYTVVQRNGYQSLKLSDVQQPSAIIQSNEMVPFDKPTIVLTRQYFGQWNVEIYAILLLQIMSILL